MKNAFARNPDGSVKTKQPCQTPGCDYPNFHVCLVGKPDTFPKVIKERSRKKQAEPRQLADGRVARWARHREEMQERDAEIVKMYGEGNIGIRSLAEHFGIAYQTVRRVLENDGVQLRSKGHTLANGAV